MFSEERKERIKHKLFNVPHGFDSITAIYDAYRENKDIRLHELVRGKSDAAVLDAYPVFIDEDDLIAGHRPLLDTSEETKAKNDESRKQMNILGVVNGVSSAATLHRVIDYEKLLEKGLSGVLFEVKQKLDAISFSDPECAEKKAFYKGCICSLLSAFSRVGNISFISATTERGLESGLSWLKGTK